MHNTWISISICSMYMVSVIGNDLLLFLIFTEHSFHEPMDLLLPMLSLADIFHSSHHTKDASNLLVPKWRYFLRQLSVPDVFPTLHLWGRVCHTAGYGIQLLCSHLLSTKICYHSNPLNHWKNGFCICDQEFLHLLSLGFTGLSAYLLLL